MSQHLTALSPKQVKQRKWKELSQYAQGEANGRRSLPAMGDPKYNAFSKQLLKIGGNGLIFVPEGDLNNLVARGRPFFDAPIERLIGKRHSSHCNSLKWWQENKTKYSIATGYALFEDGLWRQHTWLWNGTTVFETLQPCLMYWGFVLTAAEAEVCVRRIDGDTGSTSAAAQPIA